MSMVVFPQALLAPLYTAQITQALDNLSAKPFGPGWSNTPIEHDDGWVLAHDGTSYTINTLHAIFAPSRIPWVQASVDYNRTFVFWPVLWHSYGDNPEGTEHTWSSRYVVAQASKAGWFRNTLYHHKPTQHQALQALAEGGIVRRPYQAVR